MNVLIVDDQVPVVEGILSGVKWDDIGVETVCGAFSMQGAQEQFNYHSFDVAVCDIKMPFGSGVELVEWIKENYPKTETIFLTSHAEFEYAQKAVKLGCFDYLIQPVAYDELQDCIEKALKKVALGEEEGQLKAYGSAYRESREELQKSFWRDVIYNERSADAENVAVAAKRVGIDLKDDEDYLPVYLVFHERNINLEEIDKVTRAKDAFIEALPYIGIHAEYKLAELEKNALFLMLELWNDIEYERLVSQMKLFVNVSKVQLGYAWECYVGRKMRLSEIHFNYERLKDMKNDNVLKLSDVFLAENEKKEPEISGMNFGENWTQYFVNGTGEKVLSEAQQYINKLIFDKEINNRYLFAVFQKIMMSYYASLDIRHMDQNILVSDQEYMNLYRRASTPRNVDDIYNYVRYLIEINDSLETREGESTTIITHIQNYILDNIDKELSREEIAGQFFLSKDYISHLFKEKTGVSLIDYINTEKIKFAKHLLETTNLPISIISSKVGYSNFAYFSRVFKKYLDCSPNEYRKNVKGIKEN